MASNPYPELSAREFLHSYTMWESKKRNVVSFYKKDKGPFLVDLESHYSNAKAWTSRFFFVRREG